jgi:aryl-alcohol dehydrogenase
VETDALVSRKPDGPFEIERIVLDEPRMGEVLVRVMGAGMCHTDLARKSRPPATDEILVLGHEGSGIVEQVGAGVTELSPGDAVVMTFNSCGGCLGCHAGHPAYCENFFALNSTGRRGDGTAGARDISGGDVGVRWFGQSSFAQYALATIRNVVKVDPDLPIELLGPLGCGIQTGAASVINAMGVRPGESIAVFGAGAVGLSAVMAARVAGATTIIAVDLQASRRELALELGATHTLDGADSDLAEQIQGLAYGGVAYTFDTTGVPSVILSAVAALGSRGFCGLVAGGGGKFELAPEALAYGKSVSLLIEGDAVPQVVIPQMIRLWRQGRFPFDRLIKTYPMTEANLAEANSLSGVAVKPVLLP